MNLVFTAVKISTAPKSVCIEQNGVGTSVRDFKKGKRCKVAKIYRFMSHFLYNPRCPILQDTVPYLYKKCCV